jgi:hypothetical protein
MAPYFSPNIEVYQSAPDNKQIASLFPRSEQLVLSAVSLGSPGFWEFLGALTPLEVLRKYLNDRHERRKDRDYRESADKRARELQNAALENEVISRRIELLKVYWFSVNDLFWLAG